jgi:hypothetical protein
LFLTGALLLLLPRLKLCQSLGLLVDLGLRSIRLGLLGLVGSGIPIVT